MPLIRIKAHANWTAIGIRYEPVSREKNQYWPNREGFGSLFGHGKYLLPDHLPLRFLVELLTTAAKSRPMVIASWYDPTMTPLIHFGAVSDW
jgi:hypothetical protein